MPPSTIARIRQAARDASIVVVAEQGDVQAVARAIESGASDFLVQGPRLQERIATLLGKQRGLLEAIERNRRLDEYNASLQQSLYDRFEIVGRSPPMRKLLQQIQRVAKVPRPLLIVGERGTGKELVARAIHYASGVAARPLVTVNCAAFNDALLESELFGHEKGAFTGADAVRRGKFEQADGGTLFLDEIGHMSISFQQKILRVVEYGAFNRVGGVVELTTSARVIAATNCDLKQLINEGQFLPDLYDRLAFAVLEVAPLRARPGDVELLARHVLNQFARETPAFRGKTLSRDAIEVLERYPFPGNVRELKNIIERAAFNDTTAEITPADLGPLADRELSHEGGRFEEKVNDFRRRLLLDALKKSKGNQAAAARELGLSYHQFRYYFKTYVRSSAASRGKDPVDA
jgi:DNA-binding NtrC family response regulator